MTARFNLILMNAAALLTVAGCVSNPEGARVDRNDPTMLCERYGPTDVQGLENVQHEVVNRYNQAPREKCRKI